MEADYLIIGQGISGSFLSWYLLQAGKKVIVIDENKPDTASMIASGIINPVTGRRVVRTWMIEELLPFAQQAYEELGEDIGHTVAEDMDILTFHTTEQMSATWRERMNEGDDYLGLAADINRYADVFDTGYGIGVTSPCMLIDMPMLLTGWRQQLRHRNAWAEERFDLANCTIKDSGINYKGIQATNLVFCNGISCFDNPYFNRLPFAMNKGEALIVRIPGLPATNIYKQSMSIVPMGDELFWVGSSFEWEFKDDRPTAAFRQKTEYLLKNWLKLPFSTLDHKAAIRPASIERRPFVGMHPIHRNVGILNGMGTKGCSLAPYFASQFTHYLLGNGKINDNTDIARFRQLLSK